MRINEVSISVIAKVFSGYAFKKGDFNNAGIPVIKISNIRERVDLADCQFVNDSFLGLEEKFHVKRNDVLISLTGSHLTQPNSVVGRVARYRESYTSLLNQRVGKFLIKDQSKCDLSYLYYYITQSDVRRQIAQLAHGAANQANVSPGQVESINIMLPPLATQTKIASILTAYDDLIENNTRRIQILEQMAQSIYKEWFANFRFPGNENSKFVESSLGNIPEGWEVSKVKDLYDTSSGGTPSRAKTEYYENGDIKWLKTRELDDTFVFDTEEKINQLGLKNSAAKMFPAYSVIIALYGATIGKLGILANESSTNQACCALIPRNKIFNYSYIFSFLLFNRTKIIELRQGAAQQNISQELVKELDILSPANQVMEQYNEMVLPLFTRISFLRLVINNLRQTRDLLLPKLMSGEVEV